MRKFQRFRAFKIDPNDVLYSQIIRFGQTRCWKCGKHRDLQACHIISRGDYATRFLLEPVRNAIPLCAGDHDWFDTHTSNDILFNEELQKIPQPDNRWWFLVKKCGYTWQDLILLYRLSQRCVKYTTFYAQEVKVQLKAELKRLERRAEEVRE